MASSTCTVFTHGKHTVKLLTLESDEPVISCRTITSPPSPSTPPRPPKPLLVASPCDEGGEFPVVILLHGYLLNNYFYSQLMHHIASHGYIVLAPQLYRISGPDSTEEINSVASITDWLMEGLSPSLPQGVTPNLHKLALAGHSRGGKVAFALVLGIIANINPQTELKFSALIGIDPVDGMDKGKQTSPPVLTYVPRSFDMKIPALVIGSGLGGLRKNPLFPPCAPKGVSHEDFFEECRSPAWHFVGEEYGHLDMLDDETKGVRGRVSYCLCKSGERRKPMREFVGGVVVAFLRGYLDGDMEELMELKEKKGTCRTIEYSVCSLV